MTSEIPVDMLSKDGFVVPKVDDMDIASPARIYDYLLGGAANFAIDREHAQETERLMPGTGECARANRTFAVNAVAYAVDELGIEQFLDLGAGLPTAGGLHAVALQHNPNVRWVAVDYEMVAVEHGTLATEGDGRVRYIYGDFTAPLSILRNPEVREMLDFDKKIGIILCAALHLVGDDKDPAGLVATYRDATVPGSALIVSQGTLEDPTVPTMRDVPGHYEKTSGRYTPRSKEQVRRFAEGYDLVEPGIALTSYWRPDYRLHSADQQPKSGAWAFVGVRR